MVRINEWPNIFKREQFSFKVLNEQLTAKEIAEIKLAYKQTWNEWKENNLQAAGLLSLPKPKIESWTNGWKIRDHFWTCYRIDDSNACIGVLLNRRQLQVYLMYQNYKSETRLGTLAEYQSNVLKQLPAWSQTVDTNGYHVWERNETETEDHQTLTDYLKYPFDDEQLMIGKIWYFPLAKEFDYAKEVSQTVNEILPLYKSVIEQQ